MKGVIHFRRWLLAPAQGKHSLYTRLKTCKTLKTMTSNPRGRRKEHERVFFFLRNKSATQLRWCATRVWRHIQFTERPVAKLIPEGRPDKVCMDRGRTTMLRRRVPMGEMGRWWWRWGLELWSTQHGSDTRSGAGVEEDDETTAPLSLIWPLGAHHHGYVATDVATLLLT